MTGRLVHTKSDSGGVITADKESAISSLAGNEGKCAADHNSQRKTSVAGETVRNASPREEEAEINHDGSVERRSAFANKIFKRVKGSSYGKHYSLVGATHECVVLLLIIASACLFCVVFCS